jgi:hypothetical protein
MRNSLSRQRGKLPWKPSGRPQGTSAMPPAKLGSEKADRVPGYGQAPAPGFVGPVRLRRQEPSGGRCSVRENRKATKSG